MATECVEKSPIVNVGQTFVTKFGDVTLNNVFDNGSGRITVKPNGYPSDTKDTVDGRVEDFYGVMTVKTNFFTLAGNGAHFWVCGIFEDPPVMCNQTFKMQDQYGNPLNGNVQIGNKNITILGTGTTSLEEGMQVTVTASHIDFYTETRTITPCQKTEVFEFYLPEPEPEPDPWPDPWPDPEPEPEPAPEPDPSEEPPIGICDALKLIFPSLPPLPSDKISEKLCSLKVPYPDFVENAKSKLNIGKSEERPPDSRFDSTEQAIRYVKRY